MNEDPGDAMTTQELIQRILDRMEKLTEKTDQLTVRVEGLTTQTGDLTKHVDRLTERHEALAQSLELSLAQQREEAERRREDAEKTQQMRESVLDLVRLARSQDERIVKNTYSTEANREEAERLEARHHAFMKEHDRIEREISELLAVSRSHEARLLRLEDRNKAA